MPLKYETHALDQQSVIALIDEIHPSLAISALGWQPLVHHTLERKLPQATTMTFYLIPGASVAYGAPQGNPASGNHPGILRTLSHSRFLGITTPAAQPQESRRGERHRV